MKLSIQAAWKLLGMAHPLKKDLGACTPIFFEWTLPIRFLVQWGLFLHLISFGNVDRSEALLSSVSGMVLKILPNRDLAATLAYCNGDTMPRESPLFVFKRPLTTSSPAQ